MTGKRTLYIFGGALALVALLAMVILNVSAATFDSDIVPDVGGTYQLGASPEDWRSINNTIFFSGPNVGIGVTPTAPLHVQGNLRVENGDVYIDNKSYGVILRDPADACWRLTVDNSGVVGATSTTCS